MASVNSEDEKIEIELPEEGKVEIEEVDDTPPEDKGKAPMPEEIVKEVESDPLDEYSDKVKKRLSQMKKLWHDERREKERAAREREEATRFAAVQLEENRQLKQRLGAGEKVFVDEMSKAAKVELDSARERLRQAHEDGDANKIAEAQEALTDAKLKINRFAAAPLQEQEPPVERQVQAQTQRPVVDPKAEAWRSKNTWFGVDEEMTALALGLHEKLVRANAADPDFVNSQEYYKQIDSTMKKRFPEYFQDPTESSEEKESSRKKPPDVVAPVTRTTGPRKVKLTASAIATARRLGVSNEDYARELLKLERDNG